MRALDSFFRGLGGTWTIGLCTTLVLFLGWLDWISGFELSFSVFYLIPVSVSAWYNRTPACYFLGALAALVWQTSNVFAGETFSHPAFYVWNALTRLGFYFIISYILRQLRVALVRETQASRRDHLTGLHNLKAFEESLAREHSRAIRHQKPLTIGFIDLDNFKKVNDEMGHAEGDRVLTTVAHTLVSNLRKSDIIGRIGGDEFVVLLPQTGATEAEAVAQKLVHCLRVLSAEEKWPVSVSLGLVVFNKPQAEQSTSEMLKISDSVMYQVKEKGKNAYLIREEG